MVGFRSVFVFLLMGYVVRFGLNDFYYPTEVTKLFQNPIIEYIISHNAFILTTVKSENRVFTQQFMFLQAAYIGSSNILLYNDEGDI